jgi:catechol 2,3-dioxygenase-like lactoylglutathione lyase family enzyme
MNGRGQVDGARLLGLVAVALLAVGTIVAAVTVLGGGTDGELTAGKLVYTALLLSIAILVFAAGLSLSGRRPPLPALAVGVAALAVIAFALVVRSIWGEQFSNADWKLARSFVLIALGAGQAAVLLGWRGWRGGNAAWRRIVDATIAALAALVLLWVIEVASSGAPIGPKPFGLLSILYLLGIGSLAALTLLRWSERRSGPAAALELDHVVIATSDRAAAIAFYTTLLGAEVVTRPSGGISLRLGERQLNLHEPGAPAEPLAADPVRPGNSDLCFVWPGSAEQAVEMVRAIGQEPHGPVERTGARGPGRSVYCRDPDGSLIELISYQG